MSFLELLGLAYVDDSGALVAGGMPATPGITDAQLESLQHYIRQRARDAL